MKLFENKAMTLTIPKDIRDPEGPSKEATYASMCINAAQSFRREGFTVDEMKKRFRIIDALEPIADNPKGQAKLEDADADHLKAILDGFPWSAVEREIVEMTDYVSELKKTSNK